jgi:capsular polysaccharide biosynthesis protein
MPDPFDGYQFLAYLRARWPLPVIAVGVAVAVSLAISLLLPKKYTARASLVIEPPAGSDPRASTAISPIYLESLKTYEHYAASDSLFAAAVERFGLRREGQSIESLKHDVLEVEIPRNTKVLDIAVTLRDPEKAHAVATYLAEEAVKLNRKTNRAGDDELVAAAQKSVDEAARRLETAETAHDQFQTSGTSEQALKADLEQLRSMRDEVDRLALSANLTVAERQAPGAAPADSARARAAGSRAAQLQREGADLDRQIAAKEKLLAARRAEAERLDAAYDEAWTAHNDLEKRLREIQGGIGYRGERLNVFDPGVMPERPSFPKIPLNVVAAAALGLIASLFYLTVAFSLASHKAETFRKTLRVASKT